MALVRFPWEPDLSALAKYFELIQAVAPDPADVDPITRCDLGDAVDGQRYPDGPHWSFLRPDVLGVRYLVRGGVVVEIVMAFDDHGQVQRVERRLP